MKQPVKYLRLKIIEATRYGQQLNCQAAYSFFIIEYGAHTNIKSGKKLMINDYNLNNDKAPYSTVLPLARPPPLRVPLPLPLPCSLPLSLALALMPLASSPLATTVCTF